MPQPLHGAIASRQRPHQKSIQRDAASGMQCTAGVNRPNHMMSDCCSLLIQQHTEDRSGMMYPMLGSSAAEAQGLQPCRVENLAAQAEQTCKGSCRGRAPCSLAPARLHDAHTPASHAHSQAAACSQTAVLPAAAAALEPQAPRIDPASQRRCQCRVGKAIWTSPASAHERTCPSGAYAQPKACSKVCVKVPRQALQLSMIYDGQEIYVRRTHAGQFLHHVGLRGWRSRRGVQKTPAVARHQRPAILRVLQPGHAAGAQRRPGCLACVELQARRQLGLRVPGVLQMPAHPEGWGLLRCCISRAGRSFSAFDS